MSKASATDNLVLDVLAQEVALQALPRLRPPKEGTAGALGWRIRLLMQPLKQLPGLLSLQILQQTVSARVRTCLLEDAGHKLRLGRCRINTLNTQSISSFLKLNGSTFMQNVWIC